LSREQSKRVSTVFCSKMIELVRARCQLGVRGLTDLARKATNGSGHVSQSKKSQRKIMKLAETGENVMPACPSCNASALQDDMYCGNCGTLLG
jgi:hypothetical protein